MTYAVSKIATYDSRLSRHEINGVSQCLLTGHSLTSSEPIQVYVNCVYESEIPIGVVPQDPIVRMTKQQYVDSFFRDGSLKLGTLASYVEAENLEVQDTGEGVFIAARLFPNWTMFHRIEGSRCLALCTYAGDPDPACMSQFEYDSGFLIRDADRFARAIAKCLGGARFSYSMCVYRRERVVVVENPIDLDITSLSMEDFNRIAGDSRYFIKPEKYSHQREFRFVWFDCMHLGHFIKCPDAIQYCERLS